MNRIAIDPGEGAGTGQRRDTRRRDIIEAGIALQARSNTMSAVEYLRAQHIDPGIIERVLGEPAQRRAAAI